MKVSLNWIKEFVTLPERTPQELASEFSIHCAEIEDVIVQGEHLGKIEIVEVESIRPHPNADKLRLVTFRRGASGDTKKEVVCGAPNLRPGMRVPYAPIGTVFPNGLKLEAKPIRGVVSEGMLCSPAELEVGEDKGGIWDLPADAPLGKSLAEFLETKPDVILDIDNKSLTHRPDLWGHLGLAREFSAIYDMELKDPYRADWEKRLEKTFTRDASPIVPEIKGDCACLGYYGITVKNVKVAPSPAWMQDRLIKSGLRPINNLVDIGNYVMIETGGPLHMFDLHRIRGQKIIIERLKKAVPLKMLDESTAKLEVGDTVVADVDGPLVIGGIMGGESSGIADETHTVFIEAANWRPGEVRALSARLGLRSDSSQRFEKGLDTRLQRRTLLRALDLVLQLCPEATVVGKLEYAGPDLTKAPPKVITTSAAKVSTLLGREVTSDVICKILGRLDFKVEVTGQALRVTVPTYRATREFDHEADIIEEVGRILGYSSIQPESALTTIESVRLSLPHQLQRTVSDFLVMRGRALEILTYPMVGSDLLSTARWPVTNDELKLLNPLSVERDRMRPSLIPSLIEAVALNQKNYDRFRIFELGRSYLPASGKFSEEREQVAIACFDAAQSTFVELANIMEDLIVRLGHKGTLRDPLPKDTNAFLPKDWKGSHPDQYQVVQIYGAIAGGITTVHPLVLKEFKIKGNLSVAVLDLADFQDRGVLDQSSYRPLPRFPSSVFDYSVVANANTRSGDLLTLLQKLKIKEVQSSKILDIFELPDGKKSITIRTTLADPERTLPGEVIKQTQDRLIKALADSGFPLKH